MITKSSPLNSCPEGSQVMGRVGWSDYIQLLDPGISSRHDRTYRSASSPSLWTASTYLPVRPYPPPYHQARRPHQAPSYLAVSVQKPFAFHDHIQTTTWPFRMIRKSTDLYQAPEWKYIGSTNSSGGLHPSSCWMYLSSGCDICEVEPGDLGEGRLSALSESASTW